MTQNPFAAPAADAYTPTAGTSDSTAGVWRDGNVLIMEKGARLPDYCVKTNAPATKRLNRRIQWHHPAVYAALLFNVLIFLIIALIVRKTAEVEFPVSQEVIDKRKRWMIVGWGGSLGSIVVMIAGFAAGIPAIGVIGMLGFLFCLFAGIIGVRILWPSKIDDQYVYLKGADEGFLARFPQR